MFATSAQSVVYVLASETSRTLIRDERISLGEARLIGVIEYVEKPGQPLCKILVRLDDQQSVACAVFEMSGGNLPFTVTELVNFDGWPSTATVNSVSSISRLPIRLLRNIYRRKTHLFGGNHSRPQLTAAHLFANARRLYVARLKVTMGQLLESGSQGRIDRPAPVFRVAYEQHRE